MYNVVLALESSALLSHLTALHVWGEESGFAIEAVCSDIDSLKAIFRKNHFDLLIVENTLVQTDNYDKLREIKSSMRCSHIALCSSDEDFQSARKGFIIGVDDYFALPFKQQQIMGLFERIKSDDAVVLSSTDELGEKLLDSFLTLDEGIYDFLDYIYQMNVSRTLIDTAVKEIFDRNEWLDLYLNENEFLSENIPDTLEHKNRFENLFKNYLVLYPHHNETLDVIIKYILYYPENDLRQKAISEELNINKSYLSTVFVAQTNMRYVDYITYVKLMRAAWLLKNTHPKVSEIALRMDYKDIAYFSKQFKKYFSIIPSEYRMPDHYHFVI